MKRYFVLFALLLCCSLARATTVTWTLNAAFADGGTAAGTASFVNGTLSTWNVSVSGGNTAVFTPYTYTSASAYSWSFADIHSIAFGVGDAANPLLRFFRLGIGTQTGTNVPVLIDNNYSIECFDCSPQRFVTSGAITSDSTTFPIVAFVPEPASFVLVGVGIIGFFRRGLSRHAN